MKPLRILILMLEPPLPFGNAAARWYYVLLKELVARGHRVTAFATCSKPEEVERAQALFPASTLDLRCYLHPERRGLGAKLATLRRPYSYVFSDLMEKAFRAELARGYDIIHLEQVWSGWLGLEHRDRALLNLHYLARIDLGGEQPGPWFRPRQAFEEHLRFSAEAKLLRSFRWLRSCSERMVPEIRELNPKAEIRTVPLGIDASQYEFIPAAKRAPLATAPTVGLIGSMGWYPTRSAAERLVTRIWPRIREKVPAARLQIAGWNARAALAQHENAPGLTIQENLPDPKPFFESTGVLLYAPAQGSGMKIKVLEAMAFGVPVVTTSEGVEGILGVKDGLHAGISENDDELAARTVELLTNLDLQNRRRTAARKLLEEVCGPAPTVDGIERIYAEMLKERSASRLS